MKQTLTIRIERLESAAASTSSPAGGQLTPAELAQRLGNDLADLLTRGVLVELPGGSLAPGENMPGPGLSRSVALLLTVIDGQAESEDVKISEVDNVAKTQA